MPYCVVNNMECDRGCLNRCSAEVNLRQAANYDSLWPKAPAPIDYDRLAKAVVAEQERKAAKEKRKELEPLAKLLDEGFTSARVDLWVVFDHISPEARQMIADAIRAYIKAET
jgi:hypothetical protein